MTVVVDASVAVKWVLTEEHTDDALRLWDRWQAAAERILAPRLFRAEVTNVMHQQVRHGRLGYPDASEALDALLSIVAVSEPDGLYARAFAIANALGLGSTYDAVYLALADAEGCEMWTADLRFVRAAQDGFPRLRFIGERP